MNLTNICSKDINLAVLDKLIQRLRYAGYRCLNRAEYTKLQQLRSIDTTHGYSLKPFDEYKCVFVHIPKCAGISVSKSLFGNLAGGHRTLRDYQVIYSPSEFHEYFKFTIVRNPWDRLVSAYHFMKSGGINQNDCLWCERYLSGYKSFDEFVRRWVTKENVQLGLHFRPQHQFICVFNKRPGVDFIGKYENLESDFEYLRQKLGGQDRLICSNVSNDKKLNYVDYYSDEGRDIVLDVYSDDIKLFGYSFGD